MKTEEVKTTKQKQQTAVRRPTEVPLNRSGEQSTRQEQSLADLNLHPPYL